MEGRMERPSARRAPIEIFLVGRIGSILRGRPLLLPLSGKRLRSEPRSLATDIIHGTKIRGVQEVAWV
jgi:hypothetical protein